MNNKKELPIPTFKFEPDEDFFIFEEGVYGLTINGSKSNQEIERNRRKQEIAAGLKALIQFICVYIISFAISFGIIYLMKMGVHNKVAEYIYYFIAFCIMVFTMAIMR